MWRSRIALKHRTGFLYALARAFITIACDFRCHAASVIGTYVAVVGKPSQFYLHFLKQQGVEVVVGHDVAYLGEFTFGIYVCFAKCFFVDRSAACMVAVPDYLAPVYATAVDSAAVVKYYTFNISHL